MIISAIVERGALSKEIKKIAPRFAPYNNITDQLIVFLGKTFFVWLFEFKIYLEFGHLEFGICSLLC